MSRTDALGPATAAFHPLELIPWFRRFPCGAGRDVLYTFIWNCLVATLLCVMAAIFDRGIPPWSVLAVYVLVANLVGYAIHGMFWIGHRTGLDAWADRRGLAARTVYFTVLPTFGVIAGFQAWLWLFHLEVFSTDGMSIMVRSAPPSRAWSTDPGWVVSVATTSMVISFALAAVFAWRERCARVETERQRERLRVERVEREAVVANLRALQAQIEPHFLFNTLANVTSLVDRDPVQAKAMLESFIRFLRSSLAATREESTTLGAEAELIAAYLQVLQVRMGPRLRYAIDVPPALSGYRLPPMLLQPIVENAIRHGLEPEIEGGEVRIAATREDGAVTIEVRDTGAGFAATTRGGVGLTNLRERLKGLYGANASLAVSDNPPRGARVSLRLPA